jgi:dihydrofolate reductase
MDNSLTDQYNLLVYPIVLGEGKKLFDSAKKTSLNLIESQAFSTGVMKLIYTPSK